MADRLRAGVVGLRRGMGYVNLFKALAADVDLVAVADLDEAKVEQVRRDKAIPNGGASLADVLAAGVDLVVLATPVADHVAGSIAALEAGAHVLSEVPALGHVDEADKLIAAVEASGRQYMLAENACYWAFVHTLRELFRQGEIGRIFHGEAEYIHNIPELRRDASGQPTWRMNLEPITYLTHSLGPLMWISGAYPLEVTCFGTTDHFEPGVTDVQVALFKMSDGAVYRITCSFANAHWQHHRIVIFGTKATFDSGSVDVDEPKYHRPGVPHVRGPGRLPVGTSFPRAPREATLGGHGTSEWFLVKDFLDSIRSGIAPPIDVYEGLMYSVPGLCAVESARTGQVVKIPQYQERRR